jgi:uncharacterized membrane protein required for colicin V production
MRNKVGAAPRQNTDDPASTGRRATQIRFGAKDLAMGVPTLLDAAVVAPAVLLGLLGLWRGFVRSMVAWPMRWVLPLLAAYGAGKLAEIGLLLVWEMAELSRLVGPPVPWVTLLVVFVATLVPLLMFMDNLIDRVKVWTAERRIALGERVLGALLGMACGLVVAAAAIELAPIRRATADEPAWVHTSVLLPYFRGASEAVESALSLAWRPSATGTRQRR